MPKILALQYNMYYLYPIYLYTIIDRIIDNIDIII